MFIKKAVQVTLVAFLAVGSASAVYAQADNSNSKIAPASSFSGWMSDYSKANKGRVSREAYMTESGRRWDAMDQDKQGLTTDQLTSMYGYQGSTTTGTMRDPMARDSMNYGTMNNGAMTTPMSGDAVKK